MTSTWTFMVYMAGDNNLSSAGEEDLREMRRVGSTDDVNLVVQFDNAGRHGTERYRVLRDGDDVVESLGETDSGDPNVLLDFIGWARARYPADRYALVLWNHGGGWEPSAMDEIAQQVRSHGYRAHEGVERAASPLGRVFFRPSLQTILGLSTPQERAICSDDGTGHSLDTVELGKVLEKAVEVLGAPLELLGMDACLMSSLEVACQVRPYVRYMVASEESEPNEGWPYDTVLPALVENPGLSTPDLAAHIVSAYVRSYSDRAYAGDVTQAALDLSRLDGISTALGHLADALSARLPRARTQIWSAQKQAKRFWQNTLADVGSFAAEVKRATQDAPTRAAADEVMEALQPGPGRFVVAEAHQGPGVSACSGVTVYLPSPLVGVSRFYAELDASRQLTWCPMVEAYVRA